MAEIILPPEENEETPELNIDKPTTNSKVITIEFEAKKTNKVSTKDTNQQLYTTDTDAWFEFKETSLEGANGTYSVVFRNRHDGSIFQRTGDIVNGVAYYKIPHQEIRHAGAWRGQIVYTLSNGDTTAREFDYDVKGHILDGKDVREIVVEDFETLMAQLRNMKDNAELELADLKQELRSINDTAEQNETDRQVFFNDLVEDIDELQANYQELLDTGVLQTNINTKLEALEVEYAPKLTEVTAQLAQTTELLQDISINIRDFGAKVDGVTDDTESIQTAINYAKATYDKTIVYFPPGYAMASQIVVPQGIRLYGAGAAISYIKQIKGETRPLLTDDTAGAMNIHVENISFHGNDNVVPDGLINLGFKNIQLGTVASVKHASIMNVSGVGMKLDGNVVLGDNIEIWYTNIAFEIHGSGSKYRNIFLSNCREDGIVMRGSFNTVENVHVEGSKGGSGVTVKTGVVGTVIKGVFGAATSVSNYDSLVRIEAGTPLTRLTDINASTTNKSYFPNGLIHDSNGGTRKIYGLEINNVYYQIPSYISGGKTQLPYNSSTPPTVGTHNIGDWFIGTSGQHGQPIGWVCLLPGTPGTWTPMETLAGYYTHTADTALTTSDVGKRFSNEGASVPITLTLPKVVKGMRFHFTRRNSVHPLIIKPFGSEYLWPSGLGRYVSLDSDGASITVEGIANNQWVIVSESGLISHET